MSAGRRCTADWGRLRWSSRSSSPHADIRLAARWSCRACSPSRSGSVGRRRVSGFDGLVGTTDTAHVTTSDQSRPCAVHELSHCGLCHPRAKSYRRGPVAIDAPPGHYVEVAGGKGVYHHPDCFNATADWDGADVAALGQRLVRSPDDIRDLGVRPALGGPKVGFSYFKPALQEERAGLHPRGPTRHRAAMPATLPSSTCAAHEPHCRVNAGAGCTIQPHPPASPPRPEQARERLRRDQLWQRPDGRVLEALYQLTDRVEELCEASREVMDWSLRLEAAAEQKATPAWLNADEAATYTRRKRFAVQRAAAACEVSGARLGERGPWSFRPADLDRWLEEGKYNSGRYLQPRPSGRGRR